MKRRSAKTSSMEAGARKGIKRKDKKDQDDDIISGDQEVKKGPWTAEEDELLMKHIQTQGEGGWRTLPRRAGLHRCGKSCRLRWMNYLRPNVKRGHITPDEEDIILRLHRLLGNRWSLIAGRIPGRTDNEIKNYWNTHLSKKLIRQGIDPRTHKPFSDPHLIPSSLIKPNHDKGANHDDDDVTPDNTNLNSVANAAVCQSSSSNRRANHPGVSSPRTEDNNNNDSDNKSLSRDTGKEAEEEYQHHISIATKNVIQNTSTISTGTATYDVATAIATTIPPESTTGLDLCCNMMSQVRVHPNYSTNYTSTSVEQLLNQHFNDGYDEDVLFDEGDDDLFSSFLNTLINDEMMFPCNTVDHGSQSRQDSGVVPAAQPARGGGGGREGDSHALTMNIISATSSLGFQMKDPWDDPF